MKKGVITYNYDGGFKQKVADKMWHMGLYTIEGRYPIIEDDTELEVGSFLCIKGNGLIVRFLEWFTDYRGKDAKKVSIEY